MLTEAMLKVGVPGPSGARVAGAGTLALLVLVLTACGVGSASTPATPQDGGSSIPTPTLTEVQALATPSPGTTRTIDSTACAGIPISSVRLDTMGLPYTWQPNCVEAAPYDNSQPPGPTGLPQHLEVNFGVVNPDNVKVGDPIVYVIPVAEYRKMWEDNNDPSVSDTLDELSTLLEDKPEPVPTASLPVLPFERATAYNDLAVQGKYLTIQSGDGVRFVGRFAQSPVPVSNDNPQLFYIYQGYSPGDTYLVSFFYPVSTKTLPNSTDVTEEERQQVDADPTAYMQAQAQELNALSESDWDPNLSQLDAVINSLKFGN